jgi:hypothetical protein
MTVKLAAAPASLLLQKHVPQILLTCIMAPAWQTGVASSRHILVEATSLPGLGQATALKLEGDTRRCVDSVT